MSLYLEAGGQAWGEAQEGHSPQPNSAHQVESEGHKPNAR